VYNLPKTELDIRI